MFQIVRSERLYLVKRMRVRFTFYKVMSSRGLECCRVENNIKSSSSEKAIFEEISKA